MRPAVVLTRGSALRIRVEDLNLALYEIPRLKGLLNSYLHGALSQSALSAACSLRHSFVQRVARWLLLAQDRSDRDELPIPQAMLARSLGVRRSTVSAALKSLVQREFFLPKSVA